MVAWAGLERISRRIRPFFRCAFVRSPGARRVVWARATAFLPSDRARETKRLNYRQLLRLEQADQLLPQGGMMDSNAQRIGWSEARILHRLRVVTVRRLSLWPLDSQRLQLRDAVRLYNRGRLAPVGLQPKHPSPYSEDRRDVEQRGTQSSHG